MPQAWISAAEMDLTEAMDLTEGQAISIAVTRATAVLATVISTMCQEAQARGILIHHKCLP